MDAWLHPINTQIMKHPTKTSQLHAEEPSVEFERDRQTFTPNMKTCSDREITASWLSIILDWTEFTLNIQTQFTWVVTTTIAIAAKTRKQTTIYYVWSLWWFQLLSLHNTPPQTQWLRASNIIHFAYGFLVWELGRNNENKAFLFIMS